LFGWACFKPLLRRPSIFRRLVRALLYRGDPPLSSQNGALLASICVDPDSQGSGIGNEMLAAFEWEMWKRNADFVYLLTDRDENQAVQGFYWKHGWIVETEFTTPEGRTIRRYWKWRPKGESLLGAQTAV
jgi:ribosomal protein S18 acetylase RimI-like enzyme